MKTVVVDGVEYAPVSKAPNPAAGKEPRLLLEGSVVNVGDHVYYKSDGERVVVTKVDNKGGYIVVQTAKYGLCCEEPRALTREKLYKLVLSEEAIRTIIVSTPHGSELNRAARGALWVEKP